MAPSSCSGPTDLRSPGCWTEEGINSSRLQHCGKDCSRLEISSATNLFLSIISERLLGVKAGNMSAPTRFVLVFFHINFDFFVRFVFNSRMLTGATTPGSAKPAAADPPPTRPVTPPRKSVVTEIKSENLYGDFF